MKRNNVNIFHLEVNEVNQIEKFDTMRQDGGEVKNYMFIKSWVPDICNGNVISKSPIMQVMVETRIVENVDARELKEQERCSKNVVIHGIMEEIQNTYIPWKCY